MIQLLLHLWGDYLLQNDWMASQWLPVITHGLVYSILFAVIYEARSPPPLGEGSSLESYFSTDGSIPILGIFITKSRLEA